MSDSHDMGRRSDDGSWPLIEHRLTQLEKSLETGLEIINRRLDNLSYVRTETWLEREARRDEQFNALEEKVTTELVETKRISVWAFGLVVSLVLTALVGFLVWIAQGGAG